MSFHKNLVEIWLSGKISVENSYLVRFWQNEWLPCKTLTKMVILEISDRRNGYLAIIWRKMVILQDSGGKRLSCNVLAKKCHFGRTREKFGYPARFDRKLFSCKILAEWMVILQYADKNVILEMSDRKNGYLAIIWKKMVLLRDSSEKRVIFQCSGKKMSFREIQGEDWLSCTIRQKTVLLQDSGRIIGYLARPWQKWLTWKTLTERRAILQ